MFNRGRAADVYRALPTALSEPLCRTRVHGDEYYLPLRRTIGATATEKTQSYPGQHEPEQLKEVFRRGSRLHGMR